MTGPVLWPVAGQGSGPSLGAPDAMTWSFPFGLMLIPEITLSAPSWGAGPAPHSSLQCISCPCSCLRPAPHSGPLLGAALGVPACGGQEAWGESKADDSVAFLAQRSLPGRPGFQASVISSLSSVGPFPAPRILWLLSPCMICFLERLGSLCYPQSGVFRGGGLSSACVLYKPFFGCQE